MSAEITYRCAAVQPGAYRRSQLAEQPTGVAAHLDSDPFLVRLLGEQSVLIDFLELHPLMLQQIDQRATRLNSSTPSDIGSFESELATCCPDQLVDALTCNLSLVAE